MCPRSVGAYDRAVPGRRFVFTAHALALWTAAAAGAAQDGRPAFDAGRLAAGTFRYRTLVDGKEAGQSRIRIRKTETGDFEFTNVVEGAFTQSWESRATQALTPLSAKLTTGSGPEARVVFDLSYAAGRVTGFASSVASGRRAVDDPIAADTVDQRIDWAAVMSVPDLAADGRFEFHVYDPGTGLSRVTARVAGFESLSVPAGSFETARIEYRIEKRRGAETYTVFVRREAPRAMVKELFPNGAVTELVEESGS